MEKLQHTAKLKHTPAPWSVSQSPITKTDTSSVLNPVYYRNVKDKNSIGGRIIAKVMGKNIEEVEANAKLVSAAPDLLGAALLAYVKLTSSGEANCEVTARLLFDAILKATE